MKEIYITNKESGISMDEISKAMDELLSQYPNLKKVLIIPPLMQAKFHRFYIRNLLQKQKFM